MDKPEDKEYLSCNIEPHGRRWAVVCLWMDDAMQLQSDTLWESADGAPQFIAQEKLIEIYGFDRERAERAYERHNEKVRQEHED